MTTAKPPRQRHVAITGASSGIGAALARAHAARGDRLSLAGRDPDRLQAVADECAALGARADVTRCDVTDADATAGWLRAADDAAPVDIVYANAGIGGAGVIAPRTAEPGELARAIFATNTVGVVNTLTPLIDRFVARRAGHLVVIASLAALAGLPHSPAYCGSKAAIRIYAEGLRRLLRPAGVRVLTVNPGFVATPMSASLPRQGPFTWSAERAAAAILRAVDAGRAELIFPWPLRLALAAARLLPTAWVDAALARAYAKDHDR